MRQDFYKVLFSVFLVLVGGGSVFYAMQNQATPKAALDNNLSSDINVSDSNDRAKLVIIMDDIYMPQHLSKLKSLDLNITPSLFPKNDFNPETPKIAQDAVDSNIQYMVHLPLEAFNFYQKEYIPLKTNDDISTIESYISSIKTDFPQVKYINNHTGSKFTSDKNAMERLINILDKYNINFIDSITSSDYVSQDIALQKNRMIMFRDVFLDNYADVEYIKNQIRQAIKEAKAKGYAIAICHPHTETFAALRELKKEIIDSVDVLSPQDMERYLASQNINFYITSAPYQQ